MICINEASRCLREVSKAGRKDVYLLIGEIDSYVTWLVEKKRLVVASLMRYSRREVDLLPLFCSLKHSVKDRRQHNQVQMSPKLLGNCDKMTK